MSPNPAPTPEDDPALRETLKRCSPATYYAACKYRKTGCADDLRVTLLGVIERFVERDLRPRLRASDDTLRLREDLGLDSLTMMEIVMLAEEVLPLSVSNEELTQLRTLGDVLAFVAAKLAAPRPAAPAPRPPPEPWNVAGLTSRDALSPATEVPPCGPGNARA